MLQYVNGFSCAMDEEKEDFMIHFVQRIPNLEEGDLQEEMITENVASIVMGKAMAEKLLDALNEMLNLKMDGEEKV